MAVDTSTIGVLPIEFECRASFTAPNFKDFQKLLEDVHSAATQISVENDAAYGRAEQAVISDDEAPNTFTLFLGVSSVSWIDAEVRFNDLITKILARCELLEHRVGDSSLQVFMKARSEKFVVPVSRIVTDGS